LHCVCKNRRLLAVLGKRDAVRVGTTLVLAVLAAALLAIPAAAKPYEKTLKEGPFELSPYSVRLGGGKDIKTPRIKGFITHMEADVVDVRTGKVVPIQRIMLHHIVFSNRGSGPQPKSQAFYGDGEERARMDLPKGYGYPIARDDRWTFVWMLMNHRDRPDKVYIRYRMTLDRNPRLHPVVPVAWDTSHGRQGLVFDVPGGGAPGSIDQRSATHPSPVSGRIVAGLGHVHGGAKSLTLSEPTCGNRRIYASRPTWGLPSHPFYHVRPVLHEPGPIHMSLLQSEKGIPVTAGQPLTLTSRYDNQFPHVRAMGLMLAYVAPDRRVTAPCGPIPTDVKAIGSSIPGRSRAPHIPIPTYRYDARGQAVKASAPSGDAPVSTRGDASVDVTDAGFSSGNLSIPLDSTVTWRFLGPRLHNVTLASGPEGFSSDRLVGGRTFSKQFTKAGTYQFFCELYPVGMIERVVVRPG
jgi:plastocyanin